MSLLTKLFKVGYVESALKKHGWHHLAHYEDGGEVCDSWEKLLGRKIIVVAVSKKTFKLRVYQLDKRDRAKCKWCGSPDGRRGSRECDRCWELRHRIEDDMGLAQEMLEVLKGKGTQQVVERCRQLMEKGKS